MARLHLTLLAVLLPACAAETVAQPPAPPVQWLALDPPKSDARASRVLAKERGVADVYFRALAQPGFAQLGPVVDELAHFACGGTETHGRDRVIAAHQALLGAYEQRSFVVTRAWLTNDEKALAWTMTAVQSGKPITVNGLTLLWTNDDALISDVHLYFAGASPADADAGERRVFEQSGAPKEATNVALMRALVQALQDNDEAQFLALLADDIEGLTLGSGGPARGKEQALAYLRTLRRALGHVDAVIENGWGVQDFVVFEYALSGRQLAALPRIPLVRDRILRLGLVDVAELHDGKITRVWRYDAPDALAMEPRMEK